MYLFVILYIGGILCRGITEIAGESASGKTQLCMQLCLTVQLAESMNGLDAGKQLKYFVNDSNARKNVKRHCKSS